MANHVTTTVHFREISEAGKQKLRELYQRATGAPEDMDQSTFEWQVNRMWVDGAEGSPTEDDVDQYNWMIENVGAKWCYMEELEDDYFRMTSAWSAPTQGIQWLVDQIAAVDPTVVAAVNYEDEMPNFFGVMLFTKDGLYDAEEWSDSEITEMFHDEVPEALEHWNEEEEEGDDEWRELWYDNMYEVIADVQRKHIDAFVDSLTEWRKENNVL
jgi:hypothetical protein